MRPATGRSTLALFAVIVAILAVLSTGWDEDEFNKTIGRMVEAVARDAQGRYRGASKSEIVAELASRPQAEYPLRFVTTAEANELSPQFNVSSDHIVYVPRENDEFALIGVGLPDGALAIGPIPYKSPWSASYNAPVLSIVGFGALLGSFAFVLPLVRRVRRLREAADRIEKGDLTARVVESPLQDELDVLARHFNAMAARVQEHARQQEMLLYAVSHECRAPLSRLRFALELLKPEVQSEDGQRYALQCADAVGDIQLIVDDVITYARFEAEPYVQRDSVEVLELINIAVMDVAQPLHDLRIGVDVDPTLAIMADPQLFRRAMANLVRNAVQHARAWVHISAVRDGKTVRVVVADDGPGVPEEERLRVFEPFARVDASRNRETGGIGLGLAIVEAIVSSHGGRTLIEDSEDGGAAFITNWSADDGSSSSPES